MIYRKLSEQELCRQLFAGFERRQVVTDCWRNIDGKWQITSAPFVDDWSEDDYATLITCLKNTVETCGVVFGAFSGEMLKGFASVESRLLGKQRDYLDLSSLHVSADLRGRGTGRELFARAADWARQHGAKKLYISAHSAVETQAFYKALGCVEAEEYNPEHVEKEPFDCQMEFVL